MSSTVSTPETRSWQAPDPDGANSSQSSSDTLWSESILIVSLRSAPHMDRPIVIKNQEQQEDSHKPHKETFLEHAAEVIREIVPLSPTGNSGLI